MAVNIGNALEGLYAGIVTALGWRMTYKQRPGINVNYDNVQTPFTFSCGFGSTDFTGVAQQTILGNLNVWRRWVTHFPVFVQAHARILGDPTGDDESNYRDSETMAEFAYSSLSQYLLFTHNWGASFSQVWTSHSNAIELVTFTCTEIRLDPKSNSSNFVMTAHVIWRESLPVVLTVVPTAPIPPIAATTTQI